MYNLNLKYINSQELIKELKSSIKKNMQRVGRKKKRKVGIIRNTNTKYAKNLKINVKICKLINKHLYLPSMKTTEHDIQVNCVNYFRLRYLKGLIFAIPNGGQRNVIVAAKLKAEGVLSGVPDLCIPIAKKGYNGLYIELKNGKAGKVSDNQQTIMGKLQNEGYKWT